MDAAKDKAPKGHKNGACTQAGADAAAKAMKDLVTVPASVYHFTELEKAELTAIQARIDEKDLTLGRLQRQFDMQKTAIESEAIRETQTFEARMKQIAAAQGMTAGDLVFDLKAGSITRRG